MSNLIRSWFEPEALEDKKQLELVLKKIIEKGMENHLKEIHDPFGVCTSKQGIARGISSISPSTEERLQ